MITRKPEFSRHELPHESDDFLVKHMAMKVPAQCHKLINPASVTEGDHCDHIDAQRC